MDRPIIPLDELHVGDRVRIDDQVRQYDATISFASYRVVTLDEGTAACFRSQILFVYGSDISGEEHY